MGSHFSPAQQQAALETYSHRTEVALDRYKHGEISFTEAIDSQRAAVSLLQDSLASAFVVRLRNLESFQTSKGHQVPPVGR